MIEPDTVCERLLLPERDDVLDEAVKVDEPADVRPCEIDAVEGDEVERACDVGDEERVCDPDNDVLELEEIGADCGAEIEIPVEGVDEGDELVASLQVS